MRIPGGLQPAPRLALLAALGLVGFTGCAGTVEGETAELTESYARGGWIAKLYTTVLGRLPSSDEVYLWSDAMDKLSVDEVGRKFLASEEYRGRVVVTGYLRYLHRDPDPTGLEDYTAALAGGLSDEELETGLIASEEYFDTSGRDGNTFVASVYRDVLGREPDEAGFAYWSSELAAGRSREELARAFVISAENQGNVILGLYRQYLGREADAGGFAYYVGQLGNGVSREEIQLALIMSDEFTASVGGVGVGEDGGDGGGDDGGDQDGDPIGWCQDYEIACDDGTGCISEDELCDGVIHCGDGSDEFWDHCE